MAKIKLTKNELKRQKDELKMFRRYLPTLLLKKQQLQMEIRSIEARARSLEETKAAALAAFRRWIAVFGEKNVFTPSLLRLKELRQGVGNIAGVEIPVFQGADFDHDDYDLLMTPPWLDAALDQVQAIALLDLEKKLILEQQRRLERELRTTTQRVNLFEKVKIPEARANIKRIGVYLGDQQTAAVVRGKIAKRAMEKGER